MSPATATKKAVAKKATTGDDESPDKRAALLELGKEISARRADGAKWSDLAEEYETAAGRLMFAQMCAEVKPSERIKWSTVEELGEAVVEARDEQKLSWGQIAARAGCGEGRIKTAYESVSGNSVVGNRIGKGGRHPLGTAAAPKAAKATNGAKKAAAPTGKPSALAGMSLAELKAKLDGRTIVLKDETPNMTIQSVVSKAANGNDVKVKVDGKVRTVQLSNVKGIAKAKA